MPQELKQVNGRWVVTGAQQSSDLVPAVKPSAAKPQRPAAPRKPQRSWWSKLMNDLQYEVKRIQRPVGPMGRQSASQFLLNQTATGNLAITKGSLGQQGALGMVGATDNAVKMGYSLIQRHVQKKPKADPTSGQFGNALSQAVEGAYKALGAKPPSQMTQAERETDQLRRSVALNAALAPLTPGFGAAGAATAIGMGLRGGAAFAFNEALSTFLDDNTGGNVVNLINSYTGAKLPGAVNVGQDDMVDAAVKSFVPNAATSLGVGLAAGGAVAVFKNIRRNTRAHRAAQREVQERAKQEAMGLLQKDEADGYDFTPDAKPQAQAAPAAEPTFQEANAAMEQRLGVNQPEPAPVPDAPAPEPKPIPSIENATTDTFGNARDATTQPLPDADPALDPWSYDPDLPESTALGKTVSELSDNELQTVLSTPDLPVVERVNQAIEARAGIEPRPPMSAQMVMAPTDRLADDYLESVSRKLGAREDWELRPLFDPEANPDLWRRAQALTGVDDAAQLSKADMLDTLGAAAADGQAPIVNRMMGGQMLPTGEVQAAPTVFQYKGGVNEAGEQIGNSLEGVERWDPNAEGIIQVWRDANGEIGQPGITYVVNGHNRLAAAKRMGIPSMRVEYLDAPTALEARLQGAISNVSDGKGTVFDAAKLAREYGITDPAQLKAKGKPGASGFWKKGIAMGRLPEDVFQAAVNEQIPLGRALIIGESGADEETMRSAYRYLVQQGPENVREGTLREMLAMAQRSPAASSGDAAQGDILSGTEWGQSFNAGMLAKADLAAAVRQMLSKEKKLFGTVGRQAGQIERVGQVDAGAAREISGEAGRALTIFDQLKYESGPVADLLNEGTTRVLAGEQPVAVAKGIKNRLAASIQEAMGKEVAPATDVVQEDLLATTGRASGADPINLPAEDQALIAELEGVAESMRKSIGEGSEIARRALEASAGIEDIMTGGFPSDRVIPGPRRPQEPVEFTADERLAAEAQLLQQAAANGEIRPPSTPIPDLPEPAQVRLDEIEAGLAPGSRTAQAMADEVRLAVEHKQADAALLFDQRQALRDAADYEALTFEQKKDIGLAADLDEVIDPQVMPREGPPRLADRLGELMRRMAESDARMFNEIGAMTTDVRRIADEMAGVDAPVGPVRPEPLKLTAQAEQPTFALPAELSKSAPRYGRATLKFQSDLDRAAYVLANDAVKPSKAAPKFRAAVEAAGLDVDEVVSHGKKVKAAIKKAAGGGSAPQRAMEIDLPPQPFGRAATAPPSQAGAQRVKQQIDAIDQSMNDIRLKAQKEGC